MARRAESAAGLVSNVYVRIAAAPLGLLYAVTPPTPAVPIAAEPIATDYVYGPPALA